MYPEGHPTIITKDFGEVDVYFGIVHCKVIPPRGLFLPVLPYRCQKKLMFPLCHSCAEGMQQSTCTHTDEERALVGTWVSEELKLAKKKGYRITEVIFFKTICFLIIVSLFIIIIILLNSLFFFRSTKSITLKRKQTSFSNHL